MAIKTQKQNIYRPKSLLFHFLNKVLKSGLNGAK